MAINKRRRWTALAYRTPCINGRTRANGHWRTHRTADRYRKNLLRHVICFIFRSKKKNHPNNKTYKSKQTNKKKPQRRTFSKPYSVYSLYYLATQLKYIWEWKKWKESRARIPHTTHFYISLLTFSPLIIFVCQKIFPINQKLFCVWYSLSALAVPDPANETATLTLICWRCDCEADKAKFYDSNSRTFLLGP